VPSSSDQSADVISTSVIAPAGIAYPANTSILAVTIDPVSMPPSSS
jgi:hypothetical protein